MKKYLLSIFAVCSLILSPSLKCEEETFYYDEDEEYFNQGTVVGQDTGEYAKAKRRAKMRSWTIAVGSTILGITTLVLVGKNHTMNK